MSFIQHLLTSTYHPWFVAISFEGSRFPTQCWAGTFSTLGMSIYFIPLTAVSILWCLLVDLYQADRLTDDHQYFK